MRRVLFLAYYFPPHGGGGVQRSVRFCQYLPECGYLPVVVTGPGVDSDGWAPPDESLSDRVPADTEIVRVAGPVPSPSSGWRNRVERAFRRADPFDRWWLEGATAVGLEAGDDVDLIYASMSPFGTAEAASAIAAKLATPWVADLRDPWALDEWRVYTSALHRRLELGRMRTALSTANAVIMNTPEAARAFLRDVPGADGVRVHSIPNGYDASDFAAPAAEPGGRAFRIVHAGHVHTEIDPWASRAVRQLLRGEVRGLDISTRSHVYLLKAVSTLIGDRPELRSRLEVHLAGALAEDDLASLPLDVVHAHGYLPHREMIDLLKTADLLFLPMHDLPQGTRARLVPGKTYEYLGSRKPILAAVPDGDARDLLAQAGNAFLVRPKDVNGMVRVISEQMERASRGEPAPLPREEVLAQYERRQLTARLAAIFDQVVGDDGSAVRAGAVAAAR